jgi:kinesin family protein 4/21/27
LNDPQAAEGSASESLPEEKPLDIPPFRRRMTGPRSRESSEQLNGSGSRRLFFRQAASVESLHTRCVPPCGDAAPLTAPHRSLSQSQSLSQELSLARSRKASVSSHGTSSGSISHSPSASASAWSLVGHARPNLSITLPAVPPALHVSASERSVQSLEKEIMRLQEVLKERETEIATLEESLHKSEAHSPAKRLNGINGHSPSAYLTPRTLHQFDHIRESIEHGEQAENGSGSVSEHDESLERLNELMLCVAAPDGYLVLTVAQEHGPERIASPRSRRQPE